MSVQSPHGAHKWRPGPLEAQQPARALPSSWPRRSVSPRRLVSSLNGPQVAQPIAPLLSIYWLLQHAGYRHVVFLLLFFCFVFYSCMVYRLLLCMSSRTLGTHRLLHTFFTNKQVLICHILTLLWAWEWEFEGNVQKRHDNTFFWKLSGRRFLLNK